MSQEQPLPENPRRVAIRRWGLRLLWVSVAATLIGTAALALTYKRAVIDDESPHLEEDHIRSIIARESPVLYRDGQERIGVFFAQEHRQYTAAAELPQDWIDAIVAAEDKRFFTHPGVDLEGITRAVVQNIRAGRVVSGGSTLTQQTAKNLYYRPDRSLRSKWDELLNALRLEHRYSKETILEFYANQFHVSANGRGIGIAARYFFDKQVSELDLLECAFIAGMVKGPANYDPFIGRTEERRAAARARAEARTRYVIDRMQVQEKLTESEHAAAVSELSARVSEERFFNRGQFRYDSHVLLDEVEARLSEAPFPALFSELGIDNPSTAGIQIVTTVDANVQRTSTYALWHHLTEVGPVLESWEASQLALPPDTEPDRLTSAPQVHAFYLGTVQRVEAEAISVALGEHSCVVDEDGIRRVADVLAKARNGERWRRAAAADRDEIRAALTPGDVVYVSVRAPGLCDLEIRPTLQGAMVILEQGQLRAMVGGNDNRNFNRAVTARRQLGSTWKPLIYTAALQLNWSPVDPLDNREGAFPLEGVWYYPRSAHTAPDRVSLAWAGTHSENLSSVWLLYHLTDHLSAAEFQQVAARVGLAQGPSESDEDYLVRIRDDYGVISTRSRYPELAWTAARLELFHELQETDPQQALEVQSLLYAGDAERESARVRRQYSGGSAQRRLAAIQNSPHHLDPLVATCVEEAEQILGVVEEAEALLLALNEASRPRIQIFRNDPPPEATELMAPLDSLPPLSAFSHLYTTVEPGDAGLALACGSAPPEGWRPLSETDLDAIGRARTRPVLDAVDDLTVEWRFTVGVLRQLQRSAQRRALVMESLSPYSAEALQHHPDFRILVGILYVSELAARLGVETELPPVMSIPLGAVDITLEEAALMYQGLLTGQHHQFPGQAPTLGAQPSPPRSTQLIAQILDQEGTVLYSAAPSAETVSDPVAGLMTTGVLHSVIEWGTGRRASGAITVADTSVPVFGKTGTTNRYRNAAFCGYVPYWDGQRWSPDRGFTIATYVGYDDNRDMRRGTVRLAGSSGALPAWIGAAQGLAQHGLLGDAPASTPWRPGEEFVAVPVQEASGLPLAEDAEPNGRVVWAWGQRAPWTDEFAMQRRFAPIEDANQLAVPSGQVPAVTAMSDPDDAGALEDVWIPEMEP